MNNRVLALIALILAVALFAAYVNPTWNNDIADTKSAIASSDAALKAALEYLAQEEQLIKQRDAIDPASLQRLNTFLPNAVDNVGLILSLNAISAQYGLSISSIDVSSKTSGAQEKVAFGVKASPVSSVDMTLTAVGSYVAFQSFLAGVERSVRLLDVQDVSITSTDSGLYTYNMTIRLYWLP